MYRGFKLQLEEPFGDKHFRAGEGIYAFQKSVVEKNIKKMIVDNGTIDGTSVQNDWFPAVDADIFISHSHADERLATCLAGWLYEEFGLKSFIDSHVWGYSNNLIAMLDNEHSKIGENLYNYESVITSASHVHSMLSMSIASMIDKSECLLFLNTPKSLSTKQRSNGAVETTTGSPWIYSELSISHTIRKRTKEEHRSEKSLERLDEHVIKSYTVEYEAPINHLTDISELDLILWESLKEGSHHALDILYKINPI